MKTFWASSVPIRWIPDHHRASNGNNQCTVVVRAKTKKRAAEILGVSLRYLNVWCGLHDVTGGKWDGLGVPDDSAFYQPGCTKNGWIREWFELPKQPNNDGK